MISFLLTLLLSVASADVADQSAMESDDFKPVPSDKCGAELVDSLETEMLTLLCQSSGDTRCLKGLAIKSKMVADSISTGVAAVGAQKAMALGYTQKAKDFVTEASPYYNRFTNHMRDSRRQGRSGRFYRGLQRLRYGMTERMIRKNKLGNFAFVARDRLSTGGQKVITAATKSIGVLLFVADILNMTSAEAAPVNPENCRHFSNNKIPTMFVPETQSCVPLYDASQKPVLNFFEANRDVKLDTLKNQYTCHYYNKLLGTIKAQNMAASEEILEDFKLQGKPVCQRNSVSFRVLVDNRHAMNLKYVESESPKQTYYEISTPESPIQVLRVKIPVQSDQILAPQSVELIERFPFRNTSVPDLLLGTMKYESWLSSTDLLDRYNQRALHSLPIVTSRMAACCETSDAATCFKEKVELQVANKN
ncbi:MAG: hypothetical protein ABS42_00295 [Bdellovibrio sp. SCN 50-8]|nr:MAG: hypothetical protein ABS42_00295 [Bdellovibrio sp. SCN 50-8]